MPGTMKDSIDTNVRMPSRNSLTKRGVDRPMNSYLKSTCSGSKCKKLGSHHSVVTGKKLNRLKNKQLFLEPVREWGTQGKSLLVRLERQASKYRELQLSSTKTHKWQPPQGPAQGRET